MFIGFHLVLIDIWRGDLASAAVMAHATMERATQLGGDFPLFIALTLRAAVAAYLGRLDDARHDLSQAIAAAQRCGSTRLAEWPATLAGFVEVSSGDYQAALSALEPLLPMVEFFPESSEIISSSFVPEAVEAMIGLGRLDDAEPLVEAMERNGRRLDRAWTLAVGMRCRAMLQAARGDVAAAMRSVELALAEHQRLPMPFERARTQLLSRQLQRRQRRRDVASAALRDARDTLSNSALRYGLSAPKLNWHVASQSEDAPQDRRPPKNVSPSWPSRHDQPRHRRRHICEPQDRGSQPQPHLPQTEHPIPSRALTKHSRPGKRSPNPNLRKPVAHSTFQENVVCAQVLGEVMLTPE